MRWPWSRVASQDRLVVSWAGQTLAYVRARTKSNGQIEVRQMGVERQGIDSREEFVSRLKAQGFGGLATSVMLRPEQCQVLQIAEPAVAPEELRSAARYQIREMVDMHIDDITLDVMHVGDGQDKSAGQMFVVTAANTVVREVTALADELQWPLAVIDIQEMAQRNLQSAIAKREGLSDRATAALVVISDSQALLTISAHEELYYSRRLDLPAGFLNMEWSAGVEFFEDADTAVSDAFEPVSEYVPQHVDALGMGGGLDASATDSDRSQRLLVEVQRSLDLWDRTWASLPLAGLRVYAGVRSFDLSAWLSQEMGQTVGTMEIEALFPDFGNVRPEDQTLCLPLLGALLRT
jgi:MSHA biogenesis protein MshI